MEDQSSFAFLAIYGSATLRFDARDDQVSAVVAGFERLLAGAPADVDARAAAREAVRIGFLDNEHVDAARSQPIADAIIWLCMTLPTRAAGPKGRGFIVEIADKADGFANFKFVAADRRTVDQVTAKVRQDRKYIVSVSPEQAEIASRRKRTPPSRDPSLEPPPKPRPDLWLPALETNCKLFGPDGFVTARECLESGAMFVWRSRQIAERSLDEVDASLVALANFGRLHLPFGRLWAETRDFIDVPAADGPAERVEARFAIAAAENDSKISFWGFADVRGRMLMSALSGTVDRASVAGGRRDFDLNRPGCGNFRPELDEGAHRRISRACGERLLELLFLLSVQGVARENVRAGGVAGSHGKLGKRRKKLEALSAARDYTVIRVPMQYVPGDGKAASGGTGGRWVRPHCRRAQMGNQYQTNRAAALGKCVPYWSKPHNGR